MTGDGIDLLDDEDWGSGDEHQDRGPTDSGASEELPPPLVGGDSETQGDFYDPTGGWLSKIGYVWNRTPGLVKWTAGVGLAAWMFGSSIYNGIANTINPDRPYAQAIEAAAKEAGAGRVDELADKVAKLMRENRALKIDNKIKSAELEGLEGVDAQLEDMTEKYMQLRARQGTSTAKGQKEAYQNGYEAGLGQSDLLYVETITRDDLGLAHGSYRDFEKVKVVVAGDGAVSSVWHVRGLNPGTPTELRTAARSDAQWKDLNSQLTAVYDQHIMPRINEALDQK